MIRTLRPADFTAFRDLRHAAFRLSPLSFDNVEGEAIDEGYWTAYLGADPAEKAIFAWCPDEHPDRPAALCGYERFTKPKRRHRALVWTVFVAPEARGRGVASALLDHLIAHAGEQEGLERLVLSASHHPTGALALYRRRGFREFGREPGAARTGEVAMDEIHLYLNL